jgi:serine/threonine-protein kinase
MERLKNAETLLRESLALDSLYAPAWAYLAVILNRQSNIGMRPAVEGQEMAREVAFKALSIDSTNATAWSTLTGIAIIHDLDFQKARFYLDKARKLDPGSWSILKLASNMAFCQGNVEEAVDLDRQALDIDPVNPKNYLDLGYGHFCNGQYREAEEVTRHALLMSPDYLGGRHLLSLILMEQGKLPEARKAAQTEPYDILSIQARALIAETMEQHDSAVYFLQQIKDRFNEIAAYQIAQVYGHQNRLDSAFRWLDLAYEYRDGGLAQVQADPFMKSLRRDPRWNELMQKMKLTD